MQNFINRRVNVLIIDSDSESVEDIRAAFKRFMPYNHKLIQTDSLKNGLKIAHDHLIDIIVLGELSDSKTLDALERICLRSNVPVMVLSSTNNLSFLVKVFSIGACAFMTKPIRQNEFVVRLKAIIRRRIDWSSNVERNLFLPGPAGETGVPVVTGHSCPA